MRIAFFSPHCDPLAATGEPDAGGQCVYEAQMAAALSAQGHQVHVFTRRWDGRPAYEPISQQAWALRYPMGPAGFLRKEDMGPYLAEFVARILESQGDWLAAADVFHGHYWDGGVAALIAAMALDKPVVFTSHSLGLLKQDHLPDPSLDGSHFHYRTRIRAEKDVLAAAARIVALSRDETKALELRYGVDAGKISVIPGGVDLARFETPADQPKLRAALGIEADFMLFTVGRLDPRKGFIELIEAMPTVIERLRRAGRTAVFFIPAGPTHPSQGEMRYAESLRVKARALGVSHAIRWFHRLEDAVLPDYYRAADLFLCPSPYEPFGLVIVEAFACGTPVVATCHGGPAEIVSDGVDGYLADPSDPAEFGARVADALLAPEAQQRDMAEAALAKARDRYAWSAVAGALADVYQTVAHHGSEARP